MLESQPPGNSPTDPLLKPSGQGDVLSKFRLFAGFKEDELAAVLNLCDSVNYEAGETIVAQGEEAGHCMYVIVSGGVRVYYSGQDREVELAELGSGDFFGELALVDDGPRSASVVTLQPTQTLRITRMVVGVLAGVKPGAAIHLLAAIGRSLVNRLRAGNQKYLDLILLGHKDSSASDG